MESGLLGTEYHREPDDKRISYEIIKEKTRLNLVQIWKHNRPPDPLRVQEIVEHMRKTNICDGQILLAIINGKCVCYDGAHRLEASKIHFPNGGVNVRIMNDSCDNEVRKEFERINKSIPVPELYFSDDDVSIRLSSIIQEVTKGLIENYPSFVSTSRKPQRPNFNRDTFADTLSDFLKEIMNNEKLMSITTEDIARILGDTNALIRVNHYNKSARIKASTKILNKCEVNNFYLFSCDWRNLMKQIVE
jgi:hypothetical protein